MFQCLRLLFVVSNTFKTKKNKISSLLPYSYARECVFHLGRLLLSNQYTFWLVFVLRIISIFFLCVVCVWCILFCRSFDLKPQQMLRNAISLFQHRLTTLKRCFVFLLSFRKSGRKYWGKKYIYLSDELICKKAKMLLIVCTHDFQKSVWWCEREARFKYHFSILVVKFLTFVLKFVSTIRLGRRT